MIMYVVFDFGQVLVKYDPMYMTSFYVDNEADCKTVSDVVFDRKYWDRLDEGTIEYPEMIEDFKKRLPERLWKSAEQSLYHWTEHLPEIEGMRDLIMRLNKTPEILVYVVSNISREFAEEYYAHKIPILNIVCGCIFSAVCGYVKPQKEIFYLLAKRFDVSLHEAVFIDDNPNNLKGAAAANMKTILFESAEQVERELKALGVEF